MNSKKTITKLSPALHSAGWKKLLREWLMPQMDRDLENFEGNAQALRILAKARYHSGINLSAAFISTLVKCLTDSCSFDKDGPDIKKHKPGYFAAEEETLRTIFQITGTMDAGNNLCRHTLIYMLEAAK